MADNKDPKRPLTYAESGVDYSTLDPFKRAAQQAARATAANTTRMGVLEQSWSRGESAYLQKLPDGSYLAHVEEGLGTKNLVADIMYRLTGKSYYDQVAQCAVAMIVNDLVTVGALPTSVAMHLAVGATSWFKDQPRVQDLIDGWQRACCLSRCAWGGGETPTLKGMVSPTTAVIAGSAVGIATAKQLIRGDIADGDDIIFIAGNGLHANGLTLAREIGDLLPQRYLTPLPDGRPYGEVLLDPTPIYVPAIEEVQRAGVHIHYAVNITGHGWRKLMRLVEPFVYVIERLPPVQPIFDFMQLHGSISDEEAYGNFNMGAGFALFVRPLDTIDTIKAINLTGLTPCYAGHVERTERKKVIIEPKNLVYEGDTLTIR